MASNVCTLIGTYRRFKPHLLMVLVQIGYTLLYFITEASFNHGMNPHVYITYRNIVGGLAMLPFAYFIERKIRPKLTIALFLEIFVLSLLGVGLTLNMYFASLTYTSPTFLASMVNTIASLTFVIAIVLRLPSHLIFKSITRTCVLMVTCVYLKVQFLCGLEVLDLRKTRGVAKVLGTLVSLAGVMTMTLYKGSIVRNLWDPLIHLNGNTTVHENWLKGSILTVASCITWSIWYIMQAFTLKRYPAQLSLTTWMSFVGAAQSVVFTMFVQHKPAAWTIGFNIDLWSTLYGGVVMSGLVIFVQLWCTEEKGPVFVTMFNPLSTILVAVLAYFIFGERLYMGSILGGVVVIVGLYLLLWGKEGDQEQTELKEQSSSPSEEQKDPKVLIFTSDGKDMKEEP
ncbi:WAT1-related protein At2g39510-like [Actinidia eriantha]|uniref:WAT1-related protein At2g39510-like n=1 Tax=Actinidia eriantha TaxID=165200 RepID=UPI002589F170|nr:WAT1-related protein At2g39510-like [Actinidia eriantha]